MFKRRVATDEAALCSVLRTTQVASCCSTAHRRVTHAAPVGPSSTKQSPSSDRTYSTDCLPRPSCGAPTRAPVESQHQQHFAQRLRDYGKMNVRTVVWCLAAILSSAGGQELFAANNGLCSAAGGSCRAVTAGCVAGEAPYSKFGYNAASFFMCGSYNLMCCVSNAPKLDDNCGQVAPRGKILQGQNTSACDWPYIVSVRSRIAGLNNALSADNTQHSCAGVLLNERYVLTHPLCCYLQLGVLTDAPSNLLVVAGEYDVTKVDVDSSTRLPAEQYRTVDRCLVYPGYQRVDSFQNFNLGDNNLTNGNAVALLRLRDPVTFNNCANKVCLPGATSFNAKNCDSFSYCVILGWGYVDNQLQNLPSTLKYGVVRIYKDDVCNFLSTLLSPAFPRPAGTTCDIPVGVTDTRLGDEGGPVLCYDGSRFAVQGIIPFNLFGLNGKSYNPFVTDVAQFEDWIRNTIATNN